MNKPKSNTRYFFDCFGSNIRSLFKGPNIVMPLISVSFFSLMMAKLLVLTAGSRLPRMGSIFKSAAVEHTVLIGLFALATMTFIAIVAAGGVAALQLRARSRNPQSTLQPPEPW